MVKITIDNKQYEVDNKLTIIQAAKENGIHIPHFCWHPELSVSGNCRICLVEVEKMPKLVIACSTQVADGMVVYTNSDKVIKARNAVMEFILINHPLDCPICDEAGECKLQNYAYKYSVGKSRFDFNKVRKPKRIELGPNVMLDVERCIMCSRCIRFCEEVAKKPQLTFTKRGDQVVLTTFPDEKLDNPYSMNVIDLCPVGALTSKDFRFKARVWDMSSTDTICIGCSRGCNIKMWIRNNEILRLTPRHNSSVNNYWMCDEGRLETFKFVNAKNRIQTPLVRKEGILIEVGWDEAIAKVVSELKSFKKNEIAALGSAYATNEDNYLFSKMMKQFGVVNLDFMEHTNQNNEDDFLIREDKTPNALGAKIVGCKSEKGALSIEGIIRGIKEEKIKALYSLDSNITFDPDFAEVLPKLDFFVVHASNENETTFFADVVLSSATYAETSGTLTNYQGYVQRIRPAVSTVEYDRALDDFSLSRLDKYGAHNDRWTKGIKYDARPNWRILITVFAPLLGTKWRYDNVEDVFNEICENIESFRGLSYSMLGLQGVALKKKKSKATI